LSLIILWKKIFCQVRVDFQLVTECYMHHGCFLVVIVLPYYILSAKVLVWRSFRRLCLAAAGPGEFFVCSWRPRWAEGHGGSASIKLLCSPASHCGCRRLRICSVVSSRNVSRRARRVQFDPVQLPSREIYTNELSTAWPSAHGRIPVRLNAVCL